MIKAEVKYTLKHFQVLLSSRKNSLILRIWGIFIIAAIAFALADNINENGLTGNTIGLLVFWCAVLIVFLWLKYMISPQKQFKNYQKNFPNCTNTYCFDEDKLSLTSVSDVSSNTSDYVYDIVESAEEKKGLFLIKIKGVGIVVIGAEEITEGTPEDLRSLLKDRLGKKYKTKN